MRKVLFKGFIAGSSKRESEFSQNGVFLGWGIDYETYNNLHLHLTVAIIEKEDGTVVLVGVDAIKFIN